MSNVKILILCNMLFFGLPFLAFASSYNYTCSDFRFTIGTASCASNTLTFSAGLNGYISDAVDGNGTFANYPLTTAGTYYVSATVTGSTGFIDLNADKFGITPVSLSNGVNTEVPFTAPSGNTTAGIVFRNYYSGTGPGSVVISGMCIDNDGTSCSGAPPSPTPIPNRFNNLFGNATTSASSSQILAIVDIPNIDLFMGYMVFLSSASFLLWIFKSSRT